MRKITLILLLLPILGYGQTLKLNFGPSFSTILRPAHMPDRGGIENVLIGLSGTGGIDFLESHLGFLSVNAGLVQKGRKDRVTRINPNTNEHYMVIAKTQFSYATGNITANIKLSSGNLVPIVSIGPRIDYFIDQPEGTTLPAFQFGANAGIGLLQYSGNWRYGLRADYLHNFTKKPDDRTVVLMATVGLKLTKGKRTMSCPDISSL